MGEHIKGLQERLFETMEYDINGCSSLRGVEVILKGLKEISSEGALPKGDVERLKTQLIDKKFEIQNNLFFNLERDIINSDSTEKLIKLSEAVSKLDITENMKLNLMSAINKKIG